MGQGLTPEAQQLLEVRKSMVRLMAAAVLRSCSCPSCKYMVLMYFDSATRLGNEAIALNEAELKRRTNDADRR